MNIRNRNDDALFVAITIKDIEKLKVVLASKDINLADNRYVYPPLIMAAKSKLWEFVKLIAEHPNKKNAYDLDYSLFLAVEANKYSVAKALLEVGADPNTRFICGNKEIDEWTSLYEALNKKKPKLVGLLLYHGASLEAKAIYRDPENYGSLISKCNVLDFVKKRKLEDYLKLGWEEFDKLKQKDVLRQQEKDIVVIIAQGLRQRDSYVIKLPIEILQNILKLAGNKFYHEVLSAYNKINQISFGLVVDNYRPHFFSSTNSKELVAKISDGIKECPVDFHALFQLVEKYLNKYLKDKDLTLDQAANKSSLINLLKKYHIANSAEINLNKSLGFKRM